MQLFTALNGTEVDGRNIVVNESRPKQEGGGGGGGFKKRSFGGGGGGGFKKGGYNKGGGGGYIATVVVTTAIINRILNTSLLFEILSRLGGFFYCPKANYHCKWHNELIQLHF